jgi:hypothetical protein
MLTAGDDYPIHQTPEPIALTPGERNFYDRYFFNGYRQDGSLFFALAMGCYPNLGVVDAAFSVISGGNAGDRVQRNLRASRAPALIDRMDTSVGPIRVIVERPLERLRLEVASAEHGVRASLTFDRRANAVMEPRFFRRAGPRLLFDYTRLTQNGCWTGTIEIAGERHALEPATAWGTRDRSWGIRPVGRADQQAAQREPQFFWLWAPCNFNDCVTLFHQNTDGDGVPWNNSAALLALGDRSPARYPTTTAALEFLPGTRHVARAVLEAAGAEDRWRLELRRRFEFFMSGIGYGHPEWGHGHDKGELAVGFDQEALASANLNDPLHLHVQALCDAVLTHPDGRTRHGVGVLEQLILGRHRPSGLAGLIGPQ